MDKATLNMSIQPYEYLQSDNKDASLKQYTKSHNNRIVEHVFFFFTTRFHEIVITW